MQHVENPMVRYREPKETVLGTCPNCGETITDAQTYGKWEDEYFCDSVCFLDYMGFEMVG